MQTQTAVSDLDVVTVTAEDFEGKDGNRNAPDISGTAAAFENFSNGNQDIGITGDGELRNPDFPRQVQDRDGKISPEKMAIMSEMIRAFSRQ